MQCSKRVLCCEVTDLRFVHLQDPTQSTAEYARTIQYKQDEINNTTAEWMKLEIHALRAELKDTVAEVRTRNNESTLEILKVVRGFQETLNTVAARVPIVMHNMAPSNSLPTSDNVRTNTFFSDMDTTHVRTPSQSALNQPSTVEESPDSSNGTPDSPMTVSRRQHALNEMIGVVCPSARYLQGAQAIADPTGSSAEDCAPKTRGEKRGASPCALRRAIKVPPPLPRLTSHPLPYSTPVMILHPDYANIVGYGKAGASWKNKAGKLGKLCEPGEQMVQINTINVSGVPLLHTDERHIAKTLDGALTPIPISTGQKVFYVKWNTRYLVKET